MQDSPQPPETLPHFMQADWLAELGTYTFTSEKIIEFARKFDPQDFHLSEETASNSVTGSLCASRWHSASVWMRKQRNYMHSQIQQLQNRGITIPEFGPSPGFENLRWLRPVFAGETISYYTLTRHSRPSRSKPGWFIVSCKGFAKISPDQTIFTFNSTYFVNPTPKT